MEKFMSIRQYCKESRFPIKAMNKLVHSELGSEFTFTVSDGRNSTIRIFVNKFERMLARKEFDEVLKND